MPGSLAESADLISGARPRYIYIGVKATIDDQFQTAMDKVDQVVAILEPLRRRMSLTMRVILANVFIVSDLAYPCRHF